MANKKKKINKTIQKEIKKKLNGLTLFLSILFLIIGLIAGYFMYSFTSDKKDDINEFNVSLLGNEIVKLNIGEDYNDEGYVFSIMGKDYSNDVVVNRDNFNKDKEGIYYITYTLNNDDNKIELRRIIIVGGNNDGE